MKTPTIFKLFTSYSILAGFVFVLGCSFLFFSDLGSKPFWDYDEAIYANVIKDTVSSGEVHTLKLGSDTWFEKPPLYFWSSILVDTVAEHPEFSYRFTAALFGVISVLLTALIVYELSGSIVVALFAGLILITTAPFVGAAREVRLDVPAIAAILFSVYSFLRAKTNPKWYIGVWVGFGVGFMFKSVIGLLSIVFMFFWSVFHKEYTFLKQNYFWVGIGVFLLIVAPWHIYETIKFGSVFWQDYFFHHVLGRYESDIIGGSTSHTNYFNFFLNYAAPWTTIFLFLVVWLTTKINKLSPELKVMFIFAATGVTLFTIFFFAGTRILYYLLPVYPFVAIVVALSAFYFYRLSSLKNKNVIFTGVSIALIMIGFFLMIGYRAHTLSIIKGNDIITANEYEIGKIVGKDKDTELYVYEYDYWDTIKYYSNRDDIKKMTDDQILDKPFFLVMSTPFLKGHDFAPELMPYLTVLFQGEAVTLFRFNP